MTKRVLSSVVEHLTADQEVAGRALYVLILFRFRNCILLILPLVP